MIIKNYINKIGDFIIKRVAELVGIFLVVASILLFISLISYSPEDPNFIFPENQEIKNLLGTRGSFIADIFFQSIGIVSFLIPFSLFFTGLSILVNKKVIIFIENIFLKEGTIEENIIFDRKTNNFDYELLIKAAEIAQIYAFINM